MTKTKTKPAKKPTKKTTAAKAGDKSTHTHGNHGHSHDHHDHEHAQQRHPFIAENTKLKLTLPWAEVEAAYKKVVASHAKNVKMSGFRQGKVPAHIAEEKLGKAHLIEHTLEQLLPKHYSKLIADAKKTPLTQPEIVPLKVDTGSDWEVEVQIAEEPKVTITGYKKMVKKAKKAAEEQLKKQAEEEKKQAKNKKAAKATQNNTAQIGEKTPEQKEEQRKDTTLRAIFQELVTGLKPAIPELLLKDQTRYELRRLSQSLKQLNMTLDDYLQRRGQSFDQLSQEMAVQSLGQLQLEFILKAITKDAAISVPKKELEKAVKEAREQASDKSIPQENYERYFTSTLERQKLLDYLLNF